MSSNPQGVFEQPQLTINQPTSIPIVDKSFQRTLSDRFQEQIQQNATNQYTETEKQIFDKIGRGGNDFAYRNASLVIGLLIANAENFINYMSKLGDEKMKAVQQSALNWFNYNGVTLSLDAQILLFTKVQDIFDLNSLSGLKKQFNNLFREATECFRSRK